MLMLTITLKIEPLLHNELYFTESEVWSAH